MARKRLSLNEARRVALAAQGFDRRRPKSVPSRGHIRRVIGRLGLLQLDFVNVLVPAHYLVAYSRLGPYDRGLLNDVVYKGRDFIEHWAHEASIVPVECWPMLKYRRDEFKPWPNSPIMKIRGRTKYLQNAIKTVQERGPVTSNDLAPVARPGSRPGDWKKSVPRWALEVHFGHGRVSVADRQSNFQRVYDVPERIVDEPHFSRQLTRDEAQRALLDIAAKSHGVGTLRDLADYFRMSPKDAAPRIAELVEIGAVSEVAVDSWEEPAFLHQSARLPKKIECGSLLSPFDPVVWFRPRAERLFDFHYRIEIYVPASKRKWGYYVLPFLLNDRIVARVDLKADRKASQLLVLAAHEEDGIDSASVTDALALELRTLADWLGLERIKVSRKGAFARQLAASCRAL